MCLPLYFPLFVSFQHRANNMQFTLLSYFNIEMTIHNMVSFHSFKSKEIKLSVSNPKNEYVVYLSVLSQTSNCQSLGRKNKHDILKTDRISEPSATRKSTASADAAQKSGVSPEHVRVYVCIYIYIYIHIYREREIVCVYMCVYIYIYTYAYACIYE